MKIRPITDVISAGRDGKKCAISYFTRFQTQRQQSGLSSVFEFDCCSTYDMPLSVAKCQERSLPNALDSTAESVQSSAVIHRQFLGHLDHRQMFGWVRINVLLSHLSTNLRLEELCFELRLSPALYLSPAFRAL